MDATIPSKIWCIIHTTGSITKGYRRWMTTTTVRIVLFTSSYFKVGIIAQCNVKDGRRSESMKYVHIVT